MGAIAGSVLPFIVRTDHSPSSHGSGLAEQNEQNERQAPIWRDRSNRDRIVPSLAHRDRCGNARHGWHRRSEAFHDLRLSSTFALFASECVAHKRPSGRKLHHRLDELGDFRTTWSR